jgi:hypothetical protein
LQKGRLFRSMLGTIGKRWLNLNNSYTTDEHAELICTILATAVHGKGVSRDIQLGMLYDEWYDRFGEEIPNSIKKSIEIMKKATC